MLNVPNVADQTTNKKHTLFNFKDCFGGPFLLGAKYYIMRFNEVKKLIESEEDLFEINMSPGHLDSLVKNIDARAGMEFEMIVPDVESDDDDGGESEPDFDQDESVTDIRDAINFFSNGENGPRQLRNLRDTMEEQFAEWALEHFDDEWSDKAYEYVFEYLRDDANAGDIVEILGLDPDSDEAKEIIDSPAKQYYKDAALKVVEDPDRYLEWWEGARDAAQDDYVNGGGADQTDWLQSIGVDSMSSVMDHFGHIVDWPFWRTVGGSNGGSSGEEVADSFSAAVGRPAKYYGGYHRGDRRPGEYVVEPDGSLDADEGDAGLEFVSPPLPIDEMFSDLDKVKKWADNRGCYTGKEYNTGLHINVSVPGYDLSKLDYVKLALLLGDKYVLEQFNRLGNHYAKSAMDIVKNRVSQRPEDAAMMLEKLKGKMAELATKVIHSGATEKYVSINTKTGYIEFRGPGGDWLDDQYFNKIKPTLLRFVVAMDAAMDPEKYREEYLKKLYALLKPKSKDDTLSYFARYAAGELPKSALKSFIKQAQLERKLTKDPTGGQLYWWRVSNPPQSFGEIEVVARTKEEAIAKAVEPGGYPNWKNTIQTVVAKPLRPFDSSPVKATVGEPQAVGQQSGAYTYRAFNVHNNQTIGTFQAGAPGSGSAAQAFAELIAREGVRERDADYQEIGRERSSGATSGFNNPNQADYENRLGWADQTGDANYEIVNRSNGRRQMVFIANTDQDAQRKYSQWLDINGLPHDTENYGYREIALPGSTIDLQRQRAAQHPAPPTGTGREFAGWKVLLPSGEEVYRFSGVGNNQGDANRIAAEWLRNNGMGVSGEGFEVVPIWRAA